MTGSTPGTDSSPATDGGRDAPVSDADTTGDENSRSTRRSDDRRGRLVRGTEARALQVGAIATAALLVVLFFYPVSTVFVEAVVVDGSPTLSAFADILTDQFYLDIFAFTAYQAALSTVLSVAIGLPAAWLLARFEFTGRRTLRSLTILPFVLPSIMVAVGFVATFGANGTLNSALAIVGLGPVELMFTLKAILIAHAFYNAPLVARIVTAAWESVDARAIETARSLGASPLRATLDVVVPQLMPAILMGAALTFIFTFASFPIVLALGGYGLATIEVFIYRQLINLNYTEAAALAIVELVISLGLLYGYLRYEDAKRISRRGVHPPPRRSLLPDRWTPKAAMTRIAIAGYAVIAAFVFLSPIVSMILASVTASDGSFTLAHYAFLLERQATGASFQVRPLGAIRNSLVFALGTLAVAVPMGVVVSVVTTRRYRGRKLVDAIAMAPLAVSGIIVGLGLLRGLVFGVEIAGWRIAVGGSLAIVAAHAVSAYPFVTRNVTPGLAAIDQSMIESARSLGATRTRTLLDIELPLVRAGVVAGAAFAVAISIGEFNSTIVLATGSGEYTMPVAIERYLGRRLGPATAMGCVLLGVTAASFVVVDRFGGDIEERGGGL